MNTESFQQQSLNDSESTTQDTHNNISQSCRDVKLWIHDENTSGNVSKLLQKQITFVLIKMKQF